MASLNVSKLSDGALIEALRISWSKENDDLLIKETLARLLMRAEEPEEEVD